MPEPAPPRLDHSAPSGRDYLVAITLLALVLRLTVAFVVTRRSSAHWFFSQATELGCLANSLLHGYGFSSPFCGQTGPSAFLAPGYPFFVAAVFRCFGSYTMHSAECIIFTQALFSAATIPVAMWTARRAFGVPAGNLTGLLCAVNPWLIGLEALLWETSFSILMVTSLVGMAVLLKQAPSPRRWLAACLLLALAVFVNPSLVLTGLALFIAAAWFAPRRTGTRSLRTDWAIPALLFLAISCIWPARNLRVLHAFVPTRSNMGYELWQGNRPGADGFFEANLHPNVNTAEYGRYKSLGEIAYMNEKSELADAWIKSHPQRFAVLTLKRIASYWFGLGRKPSILVRVTTTLLSLGGIAALLLLLRLNRRLATLFAVPLLLLPLPYYISHPDFRFWCLLAPTLTMLLSWWVTKAWSTYRAHKETPGI